MLTRAEQTHRLHLNTVRITKQELQPVEITAKLHPGFMHVCLKVLHIFKVVQGILSTLSHHTCQAVV